jgi:hypothetical protein
VRHLLLGVKPNWSSCRAAVWVPLNELKMHSVHCTQGAPFCVHSRRTAAALLQWCHSSAAVVRILDPPRPMRATEPVTGPVRPDTSRVSGPIYSGSKAHYQAV